MGLFSSSAPKVDFSQAENTYNQMMQNVQQYLQQMYGQGRGDIQQGVAQAGAINAPYMQAGNTALSQYLASVQPGGQQNVYNQFVSSPGYQFSLQQGMQAAQRGAAASGMIGSGAEMQQLQRLGQGAAQQEWGNYLQNYQNRLSDIAGIGQRSALAQSQYEYGGGQNLAQLGYGYAGMGTQAQEMSAKAQADAMMAQQVENARLKQQSQSSLWGGIGSIIGGIGSLATGGGFSSIGNAFSNMFGRGGNSSGTNYFNQGGNSLEDAIMNYLRQGQ